MPNNYDAHSDQGVLAVLRSLVPNRQLNTPEIRHITEQHADRFRRITQTTNDLFPIEKIDEIPNIEMRPETDMPMPAMALWSGTDNCWVILVNTDDNFVIQRFSILHELHHIITHTNQETMFNGTSLFDTQAEQAADYFAACVLMPDTLLRRYWNDGTKHVEAAALHFGVTDDTMLQRLQELNLIRPVSPAPWSRNGTTHTTYEEAA